MIPVNGLTTFWVEVECQGNWEMALQSNPIYDVQFERRLFKKVAVITNYDNAVDAAYERALRNAEALHRREHVRIVKIKTRHMQPERTVVWERGASIL